MTENNWYFAPPAPLSYRQEGDSNKSPSFSTGKPKPNDWLKWNERPRSGDNPNGGWQVIEDDQGFCTHVERDGKRYARAWSGGQLAFRNSRQVITPGEARQIVTMLGGDEAVARLGEGGLAMVKLAMLYQAREAAPTRAGTMADLDALVAAKRGKGGPAILVPKEQATSTGTLKQRK